MARDLGEDEDEEEQKANDMNRSSSRVE